jgi:CRP-like cAMP-binding protein
MPYPLTNVLLDTLPVETMRALAPQLMRVPLPVRTPLYEANATPRYVHFLTSGIASVVSTMSDGQTMEAATIGREGVPQGIHLLASLPLPTRCFMQVAGTALRMEYQVLARLQTQDAHLHQALLAHAQYQNLMAAQLIACGRLHDVRSRMARWILMLQDRTGDDVFKLTHAIFAGMLGSQRTTVTAAAVELQELGMLAHERGTIRIVSRDGLEAVSCECYRVTHRLLDSLYAGARHRRLPVAGQHAEGKRSPLIVRCRR